MTGTRGGKRQLTAAGVGGFAAGLSVGAVLVGMLTVAGPTGSAADDDCGEATFATHPSADADRASVAKPPVVLAVLPRFDADPIEDLRDRHLLLPVAGVKPAGLYGSFDDKRGSARLHEAIDILAPRNTPVLAVEDGRVAKLFFSKGGGITVYQFDPTSTYCYYYAHLERYAPGLKEGDEISRGQVVGYVGTTGNAPKDTPHLHFAIFRLAEQKQWWQGTPIDPYDVLR